MFKRLAAITAAVSLGLGLSLVGAGAAQAQPTTNSVASPCVPSPASTVHHDAVTHVDYQRYSYNPKKDHPDSPNDATPPSTPLSDPDHWQANTSNYDGAGHGSDPVNSPFFEGQGQEGNNGSWFFWVGTTVVDHAAYDETIPAVTCGDSTVTVTQLSAICDGTPTYTDSQFTIANASWDNGIDNSAGTHVRAATAAVGHYFASTKAMSATVTYTVPVSLGTTQSTNVEAPCYQAPPSGGPSTVKYETVVWSMPSPNNGAEATYPQVGVSQVKDEPSQTLDVPVPTTCGTQYQVDAYVQVNGATDNAAAIDTMFAQGLAGPNGAQDGSYLAGQHGNPGVSGLNHAWKFVQNPPCQVAASVAPNFPEQTFPSCGVAGELPALPTGVTGLTFSWDGLTMVATLQEGFTFEPGVATSKTYVAVDAISYQASNADAPCYAPPVECVVNTSIPWTTEDLAPVQGADGLEFNGPHTAAMDTYQRVTAGNMQGLNSMTVTYTTGNSGYQALVVVEVDPNTDLSATSGVNHYATISSVTDVTDGIVNVQDGLWYTNKIAYGDQGGQGHPISWGAMTALMPQNTLLSAPSLHQQTQTGADATSVVKSLSSSCGSTSFVPSVPAPKFTTTATKGDPLCTVDGGASYTVTTHYLEQDATWNAETASYTYTETPHSYDKADTTETVAIDAASEGDCPQLVDHPIVTPIVTSTAIGCTTAGSFTLSNDLDAADGVIWTVDGSEVGPGTYPVTTTRTVKIHAEANGPSYGFTDGQQGDWTLNFAAGVACADLTTLALHDGTLASTGSDPTGLMLIAGFTLLFGLALVYFTTRRRKTAGL
ncbi:hypothetical protein BH09ACT6_BH09ACT6_26510 [soil metagenome]